MNAMQRTGDGEQAIVIDDNCSVYLFFASYHVSVKVLTDSGYVKQTY